MTESSNAILPPRRTSLVQVGGGLGIAASILGMLIFLCACLGYDAAFFLSLLPLTFGVVGFGLVVAGAVRGKDPRVEDTQALAAMFVCLFGVLGGLVEVAVWWGWRGFA